MKQNKLRYLDVIEEVVLFVSGDLILFKQQRVEFENRILSLSRFTTLDLGDFPFLFCFVLSNFLTSFLLGIIIIDFLCFSSFESGIFKSLEILRSLDIVKY